MVDGGVTEEVAAVQADLRAVAGDQGAVEESDVGEGDVRAVACGHNDTPWTPCTLQLWLVTVRQNQFA